MNISDCEFLLTLLEEGNITKAAERLYTSQSTLSYRIKGLERELGGVLFERSKTGITPTREGLSVADFARETLAGYEALMAKLSDVRAQSEKNEQLRLGAATSIATRFINQLLKSFQSAYPNTEIDWQANTSGKIVDLLEQKAIDVAIVRGCVHWSGRKELLFEEPHYLVSRRPMNMDNLPDGTYLSVPNGKASGQINRWWIERFGQKPQKIIEIDTIDGCLQLLDQDLGFAILPALSIAGRRKYAMEPLKWQDGQPLLQRTWCICRDDCSPFVSGVFVNYIGTALTKSMTNAIYGAKSDRRNTVG